MARLSNSFGIASDSIGAEAGELANILNRLQDSILHPTPQRERRLRRSSLEREKLASNLENVNARLSKLEQDAGTTSFTANAGPLLVKQREALELLLDRLKDLREVVNSPNVKKKSNANLWQLRRRGPFGGFIPTPSQSATSTTDDTDPQYTPPALDTEPESPIIQEHFVPTPSPPAPAIEIPTEVAGPAPTQTTQTLRGRHGAENTTAHTSHSSARAALFANRRKGAPPQTSTATAEAILDQQRKEQDALSESILKMAGALKASSQRFSSTLEADKEAVGRAGEGMAKTEQSMEAARGRMGTLRKMTEGKGWWGRMILYAWVYGLMVALVLLVFVFPKLRF
ncbi:hypothetical protein A9K55_007666 [Cordyceps militaris]|uniref:Synaptobrevin n=1 Tax=Cordyceps militaris TaxID=73501 RepID=A0A2H4SJZ1_CORMI|nr:hypothetical protein A9K55_007666 [Cordyceps militaris]